MKTPEEQLSELIIERVSTLMKWEKWKATLWYQSKNPNFGSIAPCQLVSMGRGHKVVKFIEYAEENQLAVDQIKERCDRDGIEYPWVHWDKQLEKAQK